MIINEISELLSELNLPIIVRQLSHVEETDYGYGLVFLQSDNTGEYGYYQDDILRDLLSELLYISEDEFWEYVLPAEIIVNVQ